MATGMKALDPPEQLMHQHQGCFRTEATTTVLEKVFQVGSEQLKHHDLIVDVLSMPEDLRDACFSFQRFVDIYLLAQERWCDTVVLQLEGDFIVSLDISSYKVTVRSGHSLKNSPYRDRRVRMCLHLGAYITGIGHLCGSQENAE